MVELPDEVRNMQVRKPETTEQRPSSGERRPQQRDSRPPRQSRDRDDGGRGGRGGSGGPRGRRPQRRRRRLMGGGKVCHCCVQKVKYVDYKDLDFLQRFVSPTGKIIPRRLSGNCSKHQRMLTTAVKRARNIALLPFSA